MLKALYAFHCPLCDVISIKNISKFLDRDVDTPLHRKDEMDGFNAVQKWYLLTCLRMCSTMEVEKIDSKGMRVDAMNKKVEVCFDK